ELLTKYKLRPKAIVSTHAHIDHVGGLTKLRRATGAPGVMHREGLALYQIIDEQAAPLWGGRAEAGGGGQLLYGGEVWRWGGMTANVMHTPGHTPGSISLYLPTDAAKIAAAGKVGGAAKESGALLGSNAGFEVPQLFAGDTLFAGSIGRTDLWGGSMRT